AFYFSPLDMIGWTLLGSLALVVVVGVDARAATILVLAITFLGAFQHANIKTPRWLGYLVQRPESHTVHHGRGVHYYNFADLPVFDMLFGTFHNPADFEMETGFYEGASARVVDMLLFRDVSRPEVEPAAATA
ncbi:MAG TPA: sterol desaturase family protein, partial [Alphaproteobacteria bacterium]